MILKRVTNLLYVAFFSRKIELFGGVKVDIEYHRLCLWRTCKTGFVCWTMLFCRSWRVYDSLSRDCNIFKNINCIYVPEQRPPVNKGPFCNSPWLTIVDRFDCTWSLIWMSRFPVQFILAHLSVEKSKSKGL